uniref:Uncharacterized protein n=1 Tax=Rhizophora mucronata TaxID=61149 RepID=A0A2P2QTJ8_RHIMU
MTRMAAVKDSIAPSRTEVGVILRLLVLVMDWSV